MNAKRMLTLLVSAALILTTPLMATGAGPGGGGGGSGGGNAGTAAGALYGDLYVIERDGNGEPVLKSQTIAGVTYTCQQPIAADCGLLPLNFDKTDFNPELEDACAVQAAYIDGLQEVSFGRESVSRSPATVIDKSYAEAIKAINLAAPNCGDTRAIKLDPAGRIMLCIPQEDTGLYAWKTIDAPLENLGLYRAVMTDGCFGPITETMIGEEGVPIEVTYELSGAAAGYLGAAGLGDLLCGGATPLSQADMLSAAVFIAAGADKSSRITLDEIINANNYLGINKWTYTQSKKTRTLTIDYFDFKVEGGPGGWLGYTRGVDACTSDTQASLLTREGTSGNFATSIVSVFGGSPDGVDLDAVAIQVCRAGFPLRDVSGTANVVCNDAAGGNPIDGIDLAGCGGANWFAQAAEDARKTIWYLHNWEVPEIAY